MVDTIVVFIATKGAIIGYLLIFGIIFAESGLLIGFFLPGDSLLFTAGIMASPVATAFLKEHGIQSDGAFFSLPILAIGCFIAAVVGDSVGYLFGKRVGPRLFQREDSRFFSKKNIYRAQAFYDKQGGKAIVLARFIPIVRTFAPIVAGIGEMQYSRFLMFNVVGGLLWTVGVTLAGYFLGASLPADKIDTYLLPIIILIVVVSVAPPVYHLWKERQSDKNDTGMGDAAEPG
jgi:membrane-associated protein